MTTDNGVRPIKTLLTVGQLIERHPFLKEGGIRSALFYREQNGLGAHVHNFGRKLLIDEEGFLKWLEERGDAPLSEAARQPSRTGENSTHGEVTDD